MIISSKKLKQEISDLNAEICSLKQENEELKNSISSIEESEKETDELEASLENQKIEIESLKQELATSTEAQKDFDEKVANQVRAEISAAGATPAPEVVGDEEAREALIAEYTALAVGDPKRKEFRQKHSNIFK